MELDGDTLTWFMFFLTYGLWKWETKRPGLITAFGKPTWDFSNPQGMLDEARLAGLFRD